MLQTIADDIWGLPCLAYHVQPSLQPETREAFEEVQRAIVERWPEPLHVGPKHGLHVTIYPLVPVKGSFDKDAYWQGIARQSQSLLKDLCTGHQPLELRFTRLKVTDTAIIATATEASGLIGAIRDRIVSDIPPPPGHKPIFYDLIHTTLARYPTGAAIPDDVVRRVESLPVSITAPVTRIRLVRESLFPCLVTDEIASIPLIAR
ncbi:2'-5' RNA ligase family protein [Microvirga terrestris]|uniref:2'-5' RNA ligase family protein n=1 Tax=Microvirga terrestris TaxID=2791024 RepID=A0ABS0HUR4_9HYPH|nr:2'-5' RNA ligase family protein [Microvirga terrestris]MBF9197227.1 2'-5' RNA ligase family protein [Microvirga terrestris]